MNGNNKAARRFRFGAGTFEHERAAVLDDAARTDGSGYDVLVVAEHQGLPGPWPVLTLVAEKFTGLRILYTYVPELVPGRTEEKLTVDDALGSPWLAFGATEDIVEHLLQMREELGVSRFTIMPHLMGPLEAVVAKLAGT